MVLTHLCLFSFFDGASASSAPVVSTDVIRNFSLRRWRDWKRDDDEEPRIEDGALPAELRREADAAVVQAVQAAVLPAKGVAEGAALLQAIEAREAYDSAYRKAYADAYVAEVVAEHWREDMRRMMRRRKAAMLLLN